MRLDHDLARPSWHCHVGHLGVEAGCCHGIGQRVMHNLLGAHFTGIEA